MQNIVFIPNIDLGNGRSTPYHYSVRSWQKWCDKNDVKLVEWTEPIMDHNNFPIIYQREWVFDILEHNDVDYDQVLIIDADTIVHPDCPNFFDETERKYCGVQVDGCYEWVTRSIRGFGDMLFDGQRIHPWRYINGGFQIVNSEHKSFFESMKTYYLNNSEKITNAIDTLKCGTDQTIVNYMLHQEKIDVKMLPSCYNLQDLFRKNLLYVSGREWWTDELHFLEAGWVYHYNSIPQNPMNRDANYWIKRTYEELF